MEQYYTELEARNEVLRSYPRNTRDAYLFYIEDSFNQSLRLYPAISWTLLLFLYQTPSSLIVD